MSGDAYNAVVTAEQLAWAKHKSAYLRAVIARLWLSSGGLHVSSAKMEATVALNSDSITYSVTFDSSYWTGRKSNQQNGCEA